MKLRSQDSRASEHCIRLIAHHQGYMNSDVAFLYAETSRQILNHYCGEHLLIQKVKKCQVHKPVQGMRRIEVRKDFALSSSVVSA